jgi:DNA-directed RNA polymerase beta' subunit
MSHASSAVTKALKEASANEANAAREIARIHQQERQLVEQLPPLRPLTIGMSIVTREDLEGTNIAVCEITRDIIPKVDSTDTHGTLMDPLLGATDKRPCSSCTLTMDKCPNHYGKILFKRYVCNKLQPNPIYDPLHIKDTRYLLQSICRECGHLILGEDALRQGVFRGSFTERLKLISIASIEKDCHVCGNENPTYKESKGDRNMIVMQRGEKSPQHPVYPLDAYNILSSTSPEDDKLLGFKGKNRPRDYILFGILVTSFNIRPVRYRDGIPVQNDFTEHYARILKASNAIRNYTPKPTYTPDKIEAEYFTLSKTLTNAIYDMMVGVSASNSQSKQETYSSVINKKDGAFRRDLIGKNVDACARTPIGPGPYLEVDEIGVPKKIRSELTVRVRVFDKNIKKLTELLRKGQIVRIIRPGATYAINEVNRSFEELLPGDQVDRWLQDGDYLIANRNPSLHKPSIRALKVRLKNGINIDLPDELLTGYNADFDGDEANLHMPQFIEAMAEIETLATPDKAVLSDAKGGVIVASIQDTLLGIYLMTAPGINMSKDMWMDGYSQLLERAYDLQTLIKNAHAHNYNLYTGRGLFSALLPPDLSFNIKLDPAQEWAEPRTNETLTVTESYLTIRDGLLMSGAITSKNIGVGGNLGGFIHQSYGGKRYIQFLTDLRTIANWFLQIRGFTVNVEDMTSIFSSNAEKNTTELRKILDHAYQQAAKFKDPKESAFEERKRIENWLLALNNAKTQAMTVLNMDYRTSNVKPLVESGTKGNASTYVQIHGMLGPQTVNGEPLPYGIGSGSNARVTPFFPPGVDDPRAYGFCESNLGTGLSVVDYLNHMTNAVADVARGKTGVGASGYIQTRLVKSLEDAVAAFDGTLRMSARNLIQYTTYEIGINPSWFMKSVDNRGIYYTYIDMPNVVLNLNSKYKQFQPRLPTEDELESITDFVLDKNIVERFSVFPKVDEKVRQLHHNLLKRQLHRLKIVPNDEYIVELRDIIEKQLQKARVEPGEPVGLVVATSAGEVSTQISLKLKGSVGTGASRAVSNQVSSMNTLINVPENPRDRTAYIYFTDKPSLREVFKRRKLFEYMTILKLHKTSDVYPAGTLDRSWYELYCNLYNKPMPDEKTNVIRLEFNTGKLFSYNVSLADISKYIESNKLHTYVSPDHMGLIDVYLRVTESSEEMTAHEYNFMRNDTLPSLLKIYILGIPDILQVYPMRVPYVSSVQSEEQVGDNLWNLYRSSYFQSIHPMSVEDLVPILNKLGYSVTESTREYIQVSGDTSPMTALNKYANDPGNFDEVNLAYLETMGTNLRMIYTVENVDTQATYSNHSQELNNMLGVVPAKIMYEQQFNEIFGTTNSSNSKGGGSIIPVHLKIISDVAHRSGKPIPMTMEGASKSAKGTLSLAGFEQASSVIAKRAPFNPIESMDVVPSLALGQKIRMGTGYGDIVIPSDYADELARIRQHVIRGENPFKTEISVSLDEEVAGASLFSGEGNSITPGAPPPIPTTNIWKNIPKVPIPTAPIQKNPATILKMPPKGFKPSVPITTPSTIPTLLPKAITVPVAPGGLKAITNPGYPNPPKIIPQSPMNPLGSRASGMPSGSVPTATAPLPSARAENTVSANFIPRKPRKLLNL